MAAEEALGMTTLDYVTVLWRHKWSVVAFCLIGLAVGFGVTRWMTPMYESTATLLSPKESAGSSLLGGLTGSAILQQMPGAAMSLTPNRDLLVTVLKSRKLARMVVDHFGLQQHYGVGHPDDAVRKLRDATAVTALVRESLITVSVEDVDPTRAAEMANYFIEQTDRVVGDFDSAGASRERVFLTSQLARAKADLARAENSLQRFQQQNRAVVLQEQAKGAIAAAARLKGEVMAAEVQLQVMRGFAAETNPEVVSLRRRIQEMNRQLADMEYGGGASRGTNGSRGQGDFVLPLAQVPEVGFELARLTREVTVQETLVGLLTQQFDRARIAEARDLPVVMVMDAAIPARRPARPKLDLNLALGLVSGFLVGAVVAFFRGLVLPNMRRNPA